ncbi:MAG TPA: DUF3592 domain-containing protein [Tahibacter sp.]|uniref:DUF3592 domain-containing protein n=1 Tax=Tahibacter sp. TaxID=2056211 RepID=UPI002BE491EA|nr:DUF3592 domain-containing protein [Tahibacter sp.]HSX61763.1 DUF3592 domain-containing protein [Tahibacter sp.]
MATAIRRLALPLLALLIGVAALGWSAVLYSESRSVEANGQLAPVTAIGSPKKIKQSGTRITYRADIAFTAPDGNRVLTRGTLSDRTLDAFRAGQPVQLRYLAGRPEVNRIVGDEDEGSSWLLVAVGCAGLVFGVVGLVMPARSRRSARRAR